MDCVLVSRFWLQTHCSTMQPVGQSPEFLYASRELTNLSSHLVYMRFHTVTLKMRARLLPVTGSIHERLNHTCPLTILLSTSYIFFSTIRIRTSEETNKIKKIGISTKLFVRRNHISGATAKEILIPSSKNLRQLLKSRGIWSQTNFLISQLL